MVMTLGILAGLLNTLSYVSYVRSILNGRSRPSLSSWFVWSTLHWFTVATYWSVGARDTLWAVLSSALCSSFVLLLATVRGGDRSQRIRTWEWVVLIASASIWWWFHSPFLALILGRTIHIVGVRHTIRKLRVDPNSEDALSWSLGVGSKALNVWAIDSWSVEIAFYPMYMLLVTAYTALLTIRVRWKRYAWPHQGS